MYQYLYAKKDRVNINDDELEAFRKLAKSYEKLNDQQIEQLVKDGAFVEICHDNGEGKDG